MRKALANRFSSAFHNLVGIATLAGEFCAAFAQALSDRLAGRSLPDHETKTLRAAVSTPALDSKELPNPGHPRKDRAA